MCPRVNKLYREMTSGYLNGQYCGPLAQYCCTCFNATRLPLYWTPLYFSRAVKYLRDSVFTAWPWRWRQRNCRNFKYRKTYLCHLFYDLWISNSTLFVAETSNWNIHCYNDKQGSRNADGYFSWCATQLTVCACHTCCMQNQLQIWTNSHGCEQWKWCLLCKHTATLILVWHVLPTQRPQLPCR
jgi:hypothetical protein